MAVAGGWKSRGAMPGAGAGAGGSGRTASHSQEAGEARDIDRDQGRLPPLPQPQPHAGEAMCPGPSGHGQGTDKPAAHSIGGESAPTEGGLADRAKQQQQLGQGGAALGEKAFRYLFRLEAELRGYLLSEAKTLLPGGGLELPLLDSQEKIPELQLREEIYGAQLEEREPESERFYRGGGPGSPGRRKGRRRKGDRGTDGGCRARGGRGGGSPLGKGPAAGPLQQGDQGGGGSEG